MKIRQIVFGLYLRENRWYHDMSQEFVAIRTFQELIIRVKAKRIALN